MAALMKRGHLRIGKSREHGVLVIGREWLHRAEPLRQRIGDFVSLRRHNDRRSVDAGATAIFARSIPP